MRPLKLGATLRESLAIYRTRFLQLFLTAAALSLIGRLVLDTIYGLMEGRGYPELASRLVGNLVQSPITGLVPAIMADFIWRYYNEESFSLRDTYWTILSRIGGTIAIAVIVATPSALISTATSLTTFGDGRGALSGLLLVAGIFLYLILAFAMQIFIIEKANVLDAVRRSFRLTSGYRARILGYYLVMSLIFTPFGIIVSGMMRRITLSPPVVAFVLNLWAGVIMPFMHGVMVLLYFTVRMEKDELGSDERP